MVQQVSVEAMEIRVLLVAKGKPVTKELKENVVDKEPLDQ